MYTYKWKSLQIRVHFIHFHSFLPKLSPQTEGTFKGNGFDTFTYLVSWLDEKHRLLNTSCEKTHLLHTDVRHDGEWDSQAQGERANQRRREETAPVEPETSTSELLAGQAVTETRVISQRWLTELWSHHSQRNSDRTVPISPLMMMYVHTSWLGSSKASKPV